MPTSSQPDDAVDGAGWGAVGTDDGGGEAVDGPLEDALVVVAKLSLGTSVIINWLKIVPQVIFDHHVEARLEGDASSAIWHSDVQTDHLCAQDVGHISVLHHNLPRKHGFG